MNSPLLRWLDGAPADRGIRFADGADGWTPHSYRELARRSRHTAAALRCAGLLPGARVAVVARTGPDFVTAFFGVMAAGCVPAPLATPAAFQSAGSYAEHIGAALRAAGAGAVVTDADLVGELRPLAFSAGVAQVLDAAALGDGTLGDRPAVDGRAGVPDAEAAGAELAPDPGDLALLQFTSGSSGPVRGVRVPHGALVANVEAIRAWLAMTPADATASWLPVHHDMGLVGCLITPVVSGCDLWLMRPEQFIRRPLRYLRCLGAHGARLTAMPAFGLAYLLRRVPPQQLASLDFSEVRAVIVGAERLDPAILSRFDALLTPHGLRPTALRPAYGLAESTLMVTGLPVTAQWRGIVVDRVKLAHGHAVEVPLDSAAGVALVGCGPPLGGTQLTIQATGVEDATPAEDAACAGPAGGAPLPDGAVGEIVIRGPSVAAGYLNPAGSPSGFRDGALRSGDAGFLLDGQLYPIGRLGDGIKVRGQLLLAEDLEAALVRAGLPASRLVVLVGAVAAEPTAVAVVERAEPGWPGMATAVLRQRAEGARVVVLDAARGAIARTSSGKPRRRVMWQRFLAGTLLGVERSDVDSLRVGAKAGGHDGQHGGN